VAAVDAQPAVCRAHDHGADLIDLERGFLDAGRAAAEREVADARRRAEQEARTSRRLRGLVAGLAAVLVLAMVAGGLALTLRGRADQQALVARRQTLVAESRRLGAQALLQAGLDWSLLLAVEAVRLDDSVDTRSALLTSLLRSPQALRVFRGDGNRLDNLTLSRDGRTLAAVDDAGNPYLWDTRTGTRIAGPPKQHWSFSNVVAISPDGRLLASGTLGSDLVLWDVRRAVAGGFRWPSGDDVVADVAFSPNGKVLAAGTRRGSLIFWDLVSGERLGAIVHPYHPSKEGFGVSLAFTRDGATLFTSVQDGNTIAWDVTRRRPVHTYPLGGRLAVSGDGKTLALGQQDGSIVLADARTGRRRRVLSGHSAAPTRLAFSPQRRRVSQRERGRQRGRVGPAHRQGTTDATGPRRAGHRRGVQPRCHHALYRFVGRQRDCLGSHWDPGPCPAAQPHCRRGRGRLQPARPQRARAGTERRADQALGRHQASSGRCTAGGQRGVRECGGVQP
jgi:hypothetical protein